MAANEATCLRLAAACGLPVPETELLDLAIRESTVGALGVKGQSEGEEYEGEREPTEH